jgi:CheY-like chemotaxis protein
MYDEAPSILYNAILDYNVQSDIEENGLKKEELNLTILVAEDYPLNRILIEEMLSEYGIKPDFAFNGQEAIEYVKLKQYDMVFMDINMSVMNGTDATKAIREKGIEVPIIALTANALEGDRERYLAQGMDDYISKPIDAKELNVLLKKYKALIVQKGVGESMNNSKVSSEDKLTVNIFVNSLMEAQSSLHFSASIMVKLFESFLANSMENVDELLVAQKEGNKEMLYQKAHALRGSALSLKFSNISTLCETIEYAALDKKEIDYASLIEEVEKEMRFIEGNHEEIIKVLLATSI